MLKNLIKKYKIRKLKDKSFLYLFDEPPKNEFICLDCETTGLNPKKDEILSIGAVMIKDNKIIIRKNFNIFLKSSINTNEESIKIHQIRPIDLENATEPSDAIFKLLEFIGSRPIIGYYIKFDVSIISKYTKELIGIKLPNETIEVSSMYYKTKKRSSEYEFVDLKFDTIMKELDIPELGKHDALNDAIMTSMIFLKLKDKTPAKTTFYTN
ncbi:DNA polymerase III subunit epsilon [Malaciobacter molluscorum LMG 25693]|uniref:DNA polymerase III subunit epsilon n=1 Tax=Malaciobacter molluscorum LMG 25693 TaxID=870501 RepID=A0A2G1DFA1_9BACT|nr:3'-5' exonuclease [Malaciobacter molluscorum]AXX91554.1 DNA polymerase III, epsilon subunit [Malaciobacter molluscorum LMG 25693]PHO17192.1 DNA polymerase III subunit epsilon [Malaciobacter molluscorum LMG 25693]RXJ92749.1 DNA polymerase III subunit epsilon [Malaciobacter molluscorum]